MVRRAGRREEGDGEERGREGIGGGGRQGKERGLEKLELERRVGKR